MISSKIVETTNRIYHANTNLLSMRLSGVFVDAAMCSCSHLVSVQKGLGVKLNIRSWDLEVISRIPDKIDMSKRELF